MPPTQKNRPPQPRGATPKAGTSTVSSVPIARVIRLVLIKGGHQLAVIECPYCVKRRSYQPHQHVHGIPAGAKPGWTLRAAHCSPADLERAGITKPPTNYQFWVPAGTLPAQEPRP